MVNAQHPAGDPTEDKALLPFGKPSSNSGIVSDIQKLAEVKRVSGEEAACTGAARGGSSLGSWSQPRVLREVGVNRKTRVPGTEANPPSCCSPILATITARYFE